MSGKAVRTPGIPRQMGNGDGITEMEAEDARDVPRLHKKIDYIATAVFGNPLSAEDQGLIGDVKTMDGKLDRLYHLLLGLCGTIIMASTSVSVALALH